MKSNQVRPMLVALFGVLALSTLTDAEAQAVEAPRWSIGGTDLAEGKTHFISAKAYSTNLKLKTGLITISCTALKLKEGSLLGSSVGSAGKNNEVIEFEECEVSGKNIKKCKISNPLQTTPLSSELVESEGAEPANKKGSLLVLFTPFSGTSFATFKYTTETGGTCPPETKITGEVAGQVFTDPNKPPELGTLVSLESGATEAASWLVNFPATQPKNVVKIVGGVAKEEANPGLTLFAGEGEEVTEEGTALLLLATRNSKGELESEKPAVEAPRWSIEKHILGENETHFIAAKSYSTNFKLRTGNVTVACTTVKLKEGSLLGSSVGSAGKNNEVIVFEACAASGKAGGKTIEKCKVNEPIQTTALVSELVESEKAEPGNKKGSLLVLFSPFVGSSFATLKFTKETGSNCPPESKVAGKVAAQVFTDPNTPPTLGTLVTLESGATEAHSWLLNFPETQPKKIVRIIKGEVKEEANPGLTAFSEEATEEGIALVLLAKREANGELESETSTSWGPAEVEGKRTLWSPLP